jgi:hypothetical protein
MTIKNSIAQYSGLSKEVIEVAFEEGSYPRYCDRNCDQNCDCFYENNCHGEHQNRCINDIADWLADELANLRELESKNGEASPVRRQLAMSRAQISDLAVMLLNRALPRLFTLRMLFESLLDVDRHRQAYASRPSRTEQFRRAIRLEADAIRAGKRTSTRKLAAMTGVSIGTIAGWRKSNDFQARLALETRADAKNKMNQVPEEQHPPLPVQPKTMG